MSPPIRPESTTDSLAEAYAAENETSIINAYYERPATLAGEVTGRRILDVGCGAGPLPAALQPANGSGVPASCPL